MSFWWLLFALGTTPNSCAPLEHEPITARDLAPFLPAFSRVAPDTPVAPAPAAGARRVFHPAELAAFARSHSLEIDAAQDLCFEWTMEPLDQPSLLSAMQDALADPDMHVEIAEPGSRPAPHGRLEFRREDLGAAASRGTRIPITWRGSVVYGNNRRYSIWARVTVSAGPLLIRRGDLVAVEVHSGAARLMLQARSESEARAGEMVSLRNLASNKLFHARASGKGQASIEAGEPQGN